MFQGWRAMSAKPCLLSPWIDCYSFLDFKRGCEAHYKVGDKLFFLFGLWLCFLLIIHSFIFPSPFVCHGGSLFWESKATASISFFSSSSN